MRKPSLCHRMSCCGVVKLFDQFSSNKGLSPSYGRVIIVFSFYSHLKCVLTWKQCQLLALMFHKFAWAPLRLGALNPFVHLRKLAQSKSIAAWLLELVTDACFQMHHIEFWMNHVSHLNLIWHVWSCEILLSFFAVVRALILCVCGDCSKSLFVIAGPIRMGLLLHNASIPVYLLHITWYI